MASLEDVSNKEKHDGPNSPQRTRKKVLRMHDVQYGQNVGKVSGSNLRLISRAYLVLRIITTHTSSEIRWASV